jgi:hypothetical protein
VSATLAPSLLVAAALVGSSGGPSPSAAITLVGEYVSDPNPAILFEVRSLHASTMYEADLPWGNFYSVRLTFRDPSGKEVCPLLRQPIDDPGDTQISLKSGQKLSGRVDLTARCSELRAFAAASLLVVEWAYTPVTRSASGKPARGHVTVPRTR